MDGLRNYILYAFGHTIIKPEIVYNYYTSTYY